MTIYDRIPELRAIIKRRDREGTPNPVELESKTSKPDGDPWVELVDEKGRTVFDTSNSDVKTVSVPDGDVALDQTGEADIGFAAAAWWALPQALDELEKLTVDSISDGQRITDLECSVAAAHSRESRLEQENATIRDYLNTAAEACEELITSAALQEVIAPSFRELQAKLHHLANTKPGELGWIIETPQDVPHAVAAIRAILGTLSEEDRKRALVEAEAPLHWRITASDYWRPIVDQLRGALTSQQTYLRELKERVPGEVRQIVGLVKNAEGALAHYPARRTATPLRESFDVTLRGRARYHVRLHWHDHEGGPPFSVAFDIFEIVGGEPRLYAGGMMPTPDIDQAESVLHGFVKWDGCTQWWADCAHADDPETLDELLGTLRIARHHGVAAIGTRFEGPK